MKKPDQPLDTPVQFIKGVGPRLAAIFKARDILTVRDLLYFFPRKYEDRSKLSTIRTLTEGSPGSVQLVAKQKALRPLRGRPQKLFEVKAQDSEGQWISLKWFRIFKGFDLKFEPGTSFIATGTPKRFGSLLEIVHPEVQFNLDESLHVGRVIPIYTEIEGIPTKTLRKILDTALQEYLKFLPDDLPESLKRKHHLPNLREAIYTAHFPKEFSEFRSPAFVRLIYEEFFKFEYHVLSKKLQVQKEAATAFHRADLHESLKASLSKLPFTLTGGQKKATEEIFEDLSIPHPMNRLLQGDVGAGKTAVAFLSALAVMAQGHQVALMAPTEILAEQHFKNFIKIFGIENCAKLLVGKTGALERRQILALLEGGEPVLLIGTHALIEDDVQFKKLALVIIDEQHRFGVEQRKKLIQKAPQGLMPHTLIMTATPIPRTLALTAYGDLAFSIIRERPPGRKPILTKLVHQNESSKMYEFIRGKLKESQQVYFIYPLVNESEDENFKHLTSVITAAEDLANKIFPEFKVGILHGQLNPKEKADVMEKFRANEIQILVSTTVVEVGVDVPNATIMVIEHAERFGLSQLHQLRGRVGRGSQESFCFIRTNRPPFIPTPERLEVMCETDDGFKIAEADLELRGPGEFLGTRQSGALPFKMANLVRDQEWLILARNDAIELLKDDPQLERPENLSFRKYLQTTGKTERSHLRTS